ncbi:MAG: helix-turn-helix domain-containing protein [Bryobacteraceae bacterium]|nr:helix-turn-helix domain-containing protein [Bryobacteraceae bacterium]
MKLDVYVIDTLMRDLVSHSRSASAYLVYLHLYRQTEGEGRASIATSYAVLASATGLSKRSVQAAVVHLQDRRLIRKRQARPTATPVYSVLTPWQRSRRSPSTGAEER